MNAKVLLLGGIVLVGLAAASGLTGSGQPSAYLAGGLVLLTFAAASWR